MKRRVLGFGSSCYHVTSRISEGRFYLSSDKKSVLLDLLKRTADFSGVEILTFCIMDNHFHLLVRIPCSRHISDKELLRRLKVLYRKREFNDLLADYERMKQAGAEEMLHQFRERYLRRMYSLSEFMSTLKQRFSIWFNKEMDREGPLWSGRFRSVLIQSSSNERGFRALSTVAAYIDLNAVRAGLVCNPKDYAWCGYAMAVNDRCKMLNGLKFIFGRRRGAIALPQNILRIYGKLLHSAIPDGNADLCKKHIREALHNGHTLTLGELLRCRVRNFDHGWILGDKAFVEFVAHRRAECFPTRRRDLAKRIEEYERQDLYTAGQRTPDEVTLSS